LGSGCEGLRPPQPHPIATFRTAAHGSAVQWASSVVYDPEFMKPRDAGVVVTKSLPFTEARVRRLIAAARKEGLAIGAVSIHPDGTVTIHQGIATPVVSTHNAEPPASEWEDIRV
jgi:hypothetical protein